MATEIHQETDVVVVGYGLAGSIAAIEAHDAGAQVLILEKGEYPGGLSILSGGALKCVSDVDGATDYLTQISGGRVDPALIRPFAEGLARGEDYLKKLAQINRGKVTAMKDVKELRRGVYPLPGQDAFYSIRVAQIPGFEGFPWVQRLRPAGINLMKVAFDNVDTRGIQVMMSTPVTELIVDAQQVVTGVAARNGGKSLLIKARRGVILATGGFEQSQWLQLQYLQGKPFYSMAPLTHTGDGILMAQKVGAALWHMWHLHGSYGFKFPEFPIAFRHPFAGPRNPKAIMCWVVVDKYGARYMNECQPAPQDTMHRAMEVFDPDIPGYSRIPSYIIFDDNGRRRGPLAQPLSIGQRIYEWSQDNAVEIEKGWIIRADTLQDLAQRIKGLPDNDGLMEPDTLEDTLTRWNSYVDSGRDPLHRPSGTMMRIEVPPFYAVPVWPVISNTQGGPVHDVRQQVIDPFGKPIPRLYAVGELGSFFSHLYELSGNLGECLHSGQVAGRYAAAEEPLRQSSSSPGV